ncbi:hypothetical protein [Lysobacter sp. TAB13]|uniref:hypothetical protein n=1 Tax=Lysobacter sp. TAB13 TaxID=3233065 RepID=UPI003F958AD6
MDDTSIHAGFADAQTQAKAKQAAETALQALESLLAVSPEAAGLVAHSAAIYFDGITRLALASRAILLKQTTGNLADKAISPKQTTQDLINANMEQAAEDALGILATDIFMGAAAAVAAAAAAMEAQSAGFAIDRIDDSISRYSNLLHNRRT